MEFVLMKLEFPLEGEPVFSELATFKTIGVVMNVFLLDPSSRLLSAFVWVASSNTIGLYALLDWNKEEYVFIDTGIECVRASLIFAPATVAHCDTPVDVLKLVLYPLQGANRDTLRRERHRAPVLLPHCCSPTARTTILHGEHIHAKHLRTS